MWTLGQRLLPLAFSLIGGCSGCNKEGEECDYAKPDCGKRLVCADAEGKTYHCMSREDADSRCESSDNCKIRGTCGYDKSSPVCVAVNGDDCAKANFCVKEGLCHLGDKVCVVGTDSDCDLSDACREENRCKKSGDGAAARCVEAASSASPATNR